MNGQAGAERTYGGWRRRRPVGLFGLGPAGTLTLLGTITVLLGLVTLAPHAALYAGPPMVAVAGLSLTRIHGMPLATIVVIRVRWWQAVARDWTSYRAGTLIAHPRAWQLPGVLAATMLVSAEDGEGGRYGLVWDRHSGCLTATVNVTPSAPWLADQSIADMWVASWGSWLGSLGHIPMVRWVTVTVDTAPEPGTTLADAVAASIDPQAPAAARQILTAVAAAAPQAAADTRTRVSITFDPYRDAARPADLTAAAAAVTRCLQGLTASLSMCGVNVDGLASPAELAGAVRVAFDPASRGEVSRMLAAARTGNPDPALTWLDAGPVGAAETADTYQADSGISISYAWHEAPRQHVTSSVLARLAGPGPYAKRLTLQFRPFPAAAATRALETEVNAAEFRSAYRQRTRRDATARDRADEARAGQAAAEEAAGAGVVLVGLWVTVTVTDAADLPHAAAVTEAAADASRIRLRRAWNSQAAAFASTLPCGICPPDLFRRRPR